MKVSKIILFLLCFFNGITTLEDFLEDKFYFQLYPSINEDKSYLFHAYTPDNKFITINSTEREDCQKIEEVTTNDNPIKGLSSVISFKSDNHKLLIKTCFAPDNIVEIIDEKKETFVHKNNNINSITQSLDNIKYCYSTSIINPQNENQALIMTYWTDFILKNGKEKYTHKAILFNPDTKLFSNEIYLVGSSTIIERLINNNFYARSCITFRGIDIYCSIDLNSDNSYANSFSIDTSKIFTSEPHIHLVISNEDFGKDIFQKPIPIGKEVDSIFGGFYDAFLTEYHNEKENKTMLVSSLFRKSLFASFISIADKSKIYYGINVEDFYIDQYLFNHLVPNEKELIAIYTLKTGNDMSLIMTRYNFSESNKFHRFQEYSLSNYLRDDICLKPKHIQSIFVNSFINYSQKDQDEMDKPSNSDKQYYKYQKDIVTLLACENDQKNVYYEYKKIIMPQCLNVLDEINGMAFHKFSFSPESDSITLEIETDPNLKSLRGTTIEFLPLNINLDNMPLIFGVMTDKTNYTYNISLNKINTFTNVTGIKIFKTINYRSNKPLIIPYRIKQTKTEGNALKCHLTSDECKLELTLPSDDLKCNIPYCIICLQLKCLKCEDIKGMVLRNNTCFCDIYKGLKKDPERFKYNIKRCVCQDNYSFFNNITFCMPNTILEKNYCIFDIDEVTLIPIYKELIPPNVCHYEDGLCYCESRNKTIFPTNTDNDICLYENKIWFKYEGNTFYYAKINKCIYVFNDNQLLFYSNENDCSFNQLNRYINYISECLNGLFVKDEKGYNEFIKNSKEYHPNEENVTIYKEIDNMTFHLGSEYNSNNFSKVEISKNCTSILKESYTINNDSNLLIFIVDIKRNETRSRQVEFSVYNPEPSKINEKLNLNLCLLNENYENDENNRRMEELDIITNTSKNTNESEIIRIIPPVDWNEKELEYIEELYINNSINLFDPTHPFYNDFCYKYKTPNNSDIYLADRRKKYYINEILCEDDCIKESYENETQRIVCKCPMKTEPKYINKTNFTLTYTFNDNVSAPNIKIMKCPKEAYGGANGGFYWTFISIIIFVLSYFYRKCIGRLEPLKDLLKHFKKYGNLKDDDKNEEEGKEDEDDELDHQYIPKDKGRIPLNDPTKPEEGDKKDKKDENNEINNNIKDEVDKNDKNSTKTDELDKKEVTSLENTTYFNRTKRSLKNFRSEKENNKENNNGQTVDKGENIQNENDEEKKKGGMHVEVEKDEIKQSIFQLDKNRKENTEVRTRNHEEKKDSNLIDSSRDTNSRKMMIDNESEEVSENNGKEEEKEKKGKKKGKKAKRSKSKKKIKDDNETNTNDITNENEKNSLDTKDKKKRKKSKSKSKKINLIPSEKDSQSQTNTNKQTENEIDKRTEGEIIKMQQQGDTYDKDKENDKISNFDDIIAKKRKLKESKDFDAIFNEQNLGKKKDNANEDEEEIELGDDLNKDNDLIDNNKEDKKSENSSKKKKNSKKKDKKTGKKKKNANPPKKVQNDQISVKENKKEDEKRSKGSKGSTYNKNNRTSFFSDPQEIKEDNIVDVKRPSSSRKTNINKDSNKNKYNNEEVDLDDYLQDKKNNYKSDKRGLLRLIFSMIKNNNTIFFVIFKKENDLFALVSVIILSLNFYIFINAFLMFNSSSLHLFIDQDTDLEEKTKGKYIFLNILVPSLLYYVTSKIKKRTSIKEFICDKNYQYEKVFNDPKIKDGEKNIRIHDLITDVSKFKNEKEQDTNTVLLYGIIFLIFNWYFITCFLGIYENSYDCLILNVFISLIFTLIFTLIVFVFSSILRYLGIKLDKSLLFRISQFLNPIHNFYDELPYNDSNDDDDDDDEEKKKIE